MWQADDTQAIKNSNNSKLLEAGRRKGNGCLEDLWKSITHTISKMNHVTSRRHTRLHLGYFAERK